MRHTMPLAFAACVLYACSSASSAVSVGGPWQLADQVQTIPSAPLFFDCHSESRIDVDQSGATFTATVVAGTELCGGTIAGSQTSSTTSATFSNGQIRGSSVDFKDNGGCSYTGQISGNPPTAMSGTETCVVPVSGGTDTVTGNWQMSR
jgi:hypothetical protein